MGFPFIGATLVCLGFQLHEEIIDEIFADYFFESEVDDPDCHFSRSALHKRICSLQIRTMITKLNFPCKRAFYRLHTSRKIYDLIDTNRLRRFTKFSHILDKRTRSYLHVLR